MGSARGGGDDLWDRGAREPVGTWLAFSLPGDARRIDLGDWEMDIHSVRATCLDLIGPGRRRGIRRPIRTNDGRGALPRFAAARDVLFRPATRAKKCQLILKRISAAASSPASPRTAAGGTIKVIDDRPRHLSNARRGGRTAIDHGETSRRRDPVAVALGQFDFTPPCLAEHSVRGLIGCRVTRRPTVRQSDFLSRKKPNADSNFSSVRPGAFPFIGRTTVYSGSSPCVKRPGRARLTARSSEPSITAARLLGEDISFGARQEISRLGPDANARAFRGRSYAVRSPKWRFAESAFANAVFHDTHKRDRVASRDLPDLRRRRRQ